MMHLVFSLPAFYVVARTVLPLPWPLALRLGLAALVLVAAQYHLWSRLSSGSVFAPEFPRLLVLLFNAAFGAIVLLAFLQIALDAVALASRILPGSGWAIPPAWRIGAAVAAMLLAGFGVAQAARVPPLKDVAVAIRDLPPGFEGYTILQLSDLHISRLFPEAWAWAVVARANGLGTDLTVVTGDFIDGAFAARRADVEPLRSLKARDGVWAVPGNHEYFFDYDAWMRHFAGMDISILANRHTVLTRDGGALVLAGVTDRSAAASGHPGPELDAALAGDRKSVV